MNLTSNQVDAIGNVVGGAVGLGAVASVPVTFGSSLAALGLTAAAGYGTKEVLSGPIKINKIPDSVPPELEHLKELP